MAGGKKICLLIPSHYSGAIGGAEYQVMFVLEALCQNNSYDIHYLCRRVAPDFVPRGYKIRKVGRSNGLNRFGLFYDAFKVYKALKEIAPHIIYQNVGCAYTGIAAMYAKKSGAKLIWHIASDNDVEPVAEYSIKHRLTKSLDRLFLNYGIRNADIIAGQTKHQCDLLKTYFGRKCNVLIPVAHPFPEHEIKKSEKVTVLWVGNLKPLKQPEIFVRLAKELGKTGNASFVMMGRPGRPGKWFTRIMGQIKVDSNLQYLGEVSQDEVNRRLCEGHILVNTSRYEGFSNTFVQAWMRRVPVVSLTVDPDNILVRENIGFRSGTFINLCDDVRRLIEDRALRDKMGVRAFRFARENHSVEKMVKKVSGLFE